MNFKQLLLLALVTLCSSLKSHSQSNVSVNTLTGSASVVIPVDKLSLGRISVPVSLVYHGTGIKPKDVEMNAGMGWSVETGGQVTRLIRGLPDDCKKDKNNNTLLGWIYNTNESKIDLFNIQNDASGLCSKETMDINYLNTNFGDLSDTEPDLFYVSAPGLSCQLVWSQSSNSFKTIPYRDYVVTPGYNATTGAIESFTITNDEGTQYVFASFETITQKTTPPSGGSSVEYMKTMYDQYKNGIVFNNNWHLTDITDINGSGVHLTYTTAATSRKSTDNVVVYVGATRKPQYNILQEVTPKTLYQIGQLDYGDFFPKLTFTWITSETFQTIISKITGNGRTYTFNYDAVKYSGSWYTRRFLRTFSDPGCSTPVNYRFAYVGESINSGIWATTLSDSTSTNIDYWGYFNSNPSSDLKPSLYVNPSNSSYPRYAINVTSTPGAAYTNSLVGTNRAATPANVSAGSLNKIYYATGGNTSIIYESNDYLDVPGNVLVQGGGIRVKTVIDSAVNSPVAITRNYSYLNPNTNTSSGKPTSLPQYAFTTPYTGTATGNDYWNNSTVKSETDLSPEDHTIMYEYVRESSFGSGSTLYQYYLPAMAWDNTAIPACSCAADWEPTMNYSGRTNCSVSYGPIGNLINNYPFAPNLNYDMERGLPSKVISYDDEGFPVRESSYTYQRSSYPFEISALSFDEATSSGRTIKSYSKYKIYTGFSELTSTVTQKTYDVSSSTAAQTTTTSNTYNPSHHKLMKQEVTNSDGSILATNVQYTKDFATSGTNPEVTAIGGLKAMNVNIPVETYQQVTAGGTTKTVSASLSKFKAVAVSNPSAGMPTLTTYLPAQSLKFFSANGDAAFTPYTINAGTPTNYTGYLPVQNYTTYDGHGNLVTVDDGRKHVKTVITHYYANAPAAEFSNATTGEVAFNDFDSYNFAGATFTYSDIPISITDGHSGRARQFVAGSTFSRTIEKRSFIKNYIFSAWINAANGATNTLSVTLNGGTPITLSYTGAGAIKYYQFSIPVASMPSSPSTFTVSIGTSATVVVDDLLFYPEDAEVNTYSYSSNGYYKIAQTNTNGISSYFTNDQWGRLVYAYDQDKNLIQKNSYVAPADLQNLGTLEITYSGPLNAGTAISFGAGGFNTCTVYGGITSTWNFGDGTAVVTTGGIGTSHTFATAGTYTVSVTVNSLLFGTKTTTRTITVTTPPPPPSYVTLHYINSTSGNGNISTVTFTSGGTTTTVLGSMLEGYTIPKGTYTVTVSLSGGTQYNASTDLGYGSIQVGGFSNCRNYDVHNTNTYAFPSYNMTSINSLNFNVSKNSCSVPVE